MLKLVDDAGDGREEVVAGLDETARKGARPILAAALRAEADAYVDALAEEVDEAGRRLVVRNGHARAREVTTVAGALEVTSAILPPWSRRSPKVTEVLPLLYLRGLSSSDFVPALEGFFGSAAGPSASTITRLSTAWQNEYRTWCDRDLSCADYVNCWAEGIHLTVRLDEDRACTLVPIGVPADGRKELIALSDGHGEPCESWADLLRDARRRGMRAPALAVGDGALGFWAALREVFPETAEQRDWVHKVANVLDALPKSAQPAARTALTEIRDAEDKPHARTAMKLFADTFTARFPKAVAKITDDAEQLLAFYDLTAERWIHLKTSNPIESTFATVRLRTKTTNGPGSRAAGLTMVFQLIFAAQDRWRAINAPHLVALVRAGAKFERGVLVERPDEIEHKVAA
jgi:transposase-like protein